MATPDYGMMLQQMTEQQINDQKKIDTLTAAMAPMAQTSNGQFALQDKMADQEAGQIERAAAAQALTGFQVSIGKHGELSFSAAPMQDIGQSAATQFEQQKVEDKVTAGKQNNFVDNFNQTYSMIAAETDPIKIADLNANLQSNIASLVNAKEASIRTRLTQNLGINTLDQQIAQAEQLDRQAYTQAGLAYGGPTNETWALINQRDQLNNKMYTLAQDELAKDPEVAALRSRMTQLNTLVEQKSSIAGKNLAGAMDTAGSSIAPETIEAASLALGSATPEGKKETAERLAAGSPQHLKAAELGMASPETLLAKATQGGYEGQMADRVLMAKMASPEEAKMLKDAMINFDPTVAVQDEEERKLYMPDTTMSMQSPTMQAAAMDQVNQRRAALIIRKFNKERELRIVTGADKIGQQDGWDIPTDPLLQEIPTISRDIKANNPKTVVDVNLIIDRMDWKQETKAQKIAALSNYLYAQAQKDPNNVVLGGVRGYRSQQEIQQMVTSKIEANRAAALQIQALNDMAIYGVW